MNKLYLWNVKYEFWCWQSETFSWSACKHRVVNHATTAKGSWLVTLEHENNAPFPKPWGPQMGGSTGGHNIDSHFTMVYCHCEPHSSPLPLSRRRRGSRGEPTRGEERRGGEDRYHIPVRAQSVLSNWSLSCLPLEASWTKHRPVDSLRTLL